MTSIPPKPLISGSLHNDRGGAITVCYISKVLPKHPHMHGFSETVPLGHSSLWKLWSARRLPLGDCWVCWFGRPTEAEEIRLTRDTGIGTNTKVTRSLQVFQSDRLWASFLLWVSSVLCLPGLPLRLSSLGWTLPFGLVCGAVLRAVLLFAANSSS